jgi:hexosaminidase
MPILCRSGVLRFVAGFVPLALALGGCRAAEGQAASGQAAPGQSAPGQVQVHLLPAPREAQFGEPADLPARIEVIVPGHAPEDEFAAHDLEDALKQLPPGGSRGAIYRIELLRTATAEAKDVLRRNKLDFTPAMQSQGYALAIGKRAAYILGFTSSGVFYGVQTFKQLLPLPGQPRVAPTGTVRDWPAMQFRGVSDDLSRGPFPTLEFQEQQIRVFASFKLNIYSPYFENTLLYPDHPLAAPPGGSLTPAQAAQLVAYARQYHVTILPQQEAFGHVHQVLKWERYQDVAETPHGYVLAPGQPGSLPLIQDWFTQLAKEFPSPFLHIGADETFDLGVGRTREQVAQQGYGQVYAAFVKQIHDALAPLHRRLLFWGDIADKNPEAIPLLPKDMIAVPWNYEASTDFNKLIEPFAKAGMQTWVAPGDSNWNRVYPEDRTALLNIQRFIAAGQQLGSKGALTTVWNDDGEGLFNMDWYGVLFGAVAAWQPGESSIADYQEDYGQVFHHDTSGKINIAEKELMAAGEEIAGADTGLTSDMLFWVDPWSAQGQAASAKLLPVVKQVRLHAEQAMVLLDQARRQEADLLAPGALEAMDLGARRLDLIGLKFELAHEMASMYAQALSQQHDKTRQQATDIMLSEISGNDGRCQDLRDAYSALKAEYSRVWLGENRPYWLNNVTVRYDLAIQRWQSRGERIAIAARDWQDGKNLPAAASLGLPSAPAAGQSAP